MKTTQKFRKLIPLLVLLGITLFSGMLCEKNIPEIDKLPPATQIGADTFGCLIDGKVFIPKSKGFMDGSNLQCQYQYLEQNNQPPCNYFALGAGDSKSYPDQIYGIALSAQCMDLGVGNYELTNYQELFSLAGRFSIIGFNGIEEYYTNSIHKGELNITRFDLEKQIMSGTFWFDAVNQDGKKVEVRDGRFDVHFIR